MRTYIGTKLVFAEPQSKFGGPNYLTDSEPGYRIVYPNGYESWSPAKAFEAAYVPLAEMAGPGHIESSYGTITITPPADMLDKIHREGLKQQIASNQHTPDGDERAQKRQNDIYAALRADTGEGKAEGAQRAGTRATDPGAYSRRCRALELAIQRSIGMSHIGQVTLPRLLSDAVAIEQYLLGAIPAEKEAVR